MLIQTQLLNPFHYIFFLHSSQSTMICHCAAPSFIFFLHFLFSSPHLSILLPHPHSFNQTFVLLVLSVACMLCLWVIKKWKRKQTNNAALDCTYCKSMHHHQTKRFVVGVAVLLWLLVMVWLSHSFDPLFVWLLVGLRMDVSFSFNGLLTNPWSALRFWGLSSRFLAILSRVYIVLNKYNFYWFVGLGYCGIP